MALIPSSTLLLTPTGYLSVAELYKEKSPKIHTEGGFSTVTIDLGPKRLPIARICVDTGLRLDVARQGILVGPGQLTTRACESKKGDKLNCFINNIHYRAVRDEDEYLRAIANGEYWADSILAKEQLYLVLNQSASYKRGFLVGVMASTRGCVDDDSCYLLVRGYDQAKIIYTLMAEFGVFCEIEDNLFRSDRYFKVIVDENTFLTNISEIPKKPSKLVGNVTITDVYLTSMQSYVVRGLDGVKYLSNTFVLAAM